MQTSLGDYYSHRAAEYEGIYQRPERQQDLAALRSAVQRLVAGHDLLEIACGTGYWTEVAAPVARSVLATDASAAMLEMARRKPYPEGQVRFELADAFSLSSLSRRKALGRASLPRLFTAGLAAFWWSHVPLGRIRPFLEDLNRFLEPGAQMVFLDNRYFEGSSTPIARRDAAGNTYQIRRLKDGSIYEVLKNFPTAAELHRAVDGLAREVELVEMQYYWCLSYTVEGRS